MKLIMYPEPSYDEWWCAWYVCTDCEKSWINTNFKFCPNCGVGITWINNDKNNEI